MEQIYSINLIYFNILYFLDKNDSIQFSQTSRSLNRICKENGYLFSIIVKKKNQISFANLHQKTARCVSIYNFSNYPLSFFPSKIKLCNSLMTEVSNINGNENVTENVTEISYENEIPVDINFRRFPNIERLHRKLRSSDNPINECIRALSKLTHLSLYHVSNVSCFGEYISLLPCLEEFYTNFSISHLNIVSTNIKVIVTLGKNDSISIPTSSDLSIYSNGYGMCISNNIKNNLPETFEHHLSKHLIPQYKWYMCNILCGLQSHQKDDFVGSLNTNIERNPKCITMYFRDETQPYYYQEDEEQINEIDYMDDEEDEIDYTNEEDRELFDNLFLRLSWENRQYGSCF